ncbi:MAG: DUF1700 domain-containing protein [Clostridiales bacterium]|nr:DUF1700 domain-containing protein [Clostridiales bacterium]
MSKYEYLNILQERLRVLPEEERTSVLQYYTEYFEDAGIDNEDRVVSELGDVNILADKIIKESGICEDTFGKNYAPNMNMNVNTGYAQGQPEANYTQNQNFTQDQNYTQNQSFTQKTGMSTGVLIAIIATAPLWFSLIVAMFGVIVGFGAAGISLIISGVAVIGIGIARLFVEAITGTFLVGIGLIVFALGLGFTMATAAICTGTTKFIKWLFERGKR